MTYSSDEPAGDEPAEDLRSVLAAAVEAGGDDSGPAEVGELSDEPFVRHASANAAAAIDEAAELSASGLLDDSGEHQSNPSEETRQSTGPDAAPTVSAPANWRATDREMFDTLPEPARKFLLERHRAMEADHTRKTQAVAELKREYEPVDQMFAPYRDVMRQRGLTAHGLIEGWVNVERRLAEGDGVDVIKGIVAGYNIDPANVVKALTAEHARPAAATAPQPAAAQAQAAAPQVSPELAREIARLRERVETDDRARAEAERAALAASRLKFLDDLEKFKNAKDTQGNPLHPHIAEVEEDMARLALAARFRGRALPALQELYQMAVRANPSTYEAQRTAEAQSAERRRQDEARAKAAAARKAGSSVTGAPGSGQPPAGRAPGRSLREELEAAAADAA
jgi:hypothetical protein